MMTKVRLHLTVIFLLVLVLHNLIEVSTAKDLDADEFARNFYQRFRAYYETNQTDPVLDNLKDDMVHAIEKSVKLIDFPVEANARVCLKCYIAAHSFIQLKKDKAYGEDKLKAFMNKLCVYGEIDSEIVCNGNIEANFPSADFIFTSKPNATARFICEKTMPEYYCVRNDDTYEHALTVEKPELSGSKSFNFVSIGQLTVLQLSDFHYDRYYSVGSSSVCEDWVCCRGEQVPPNSDAPRAGYWGDYHACDSPGRLAENILQQVASIAAKRKIDFVYFTGDFADHFSWNLTREHCQDEIKFVTDLMKKYLPGIPVYSVLGNHEGYPANFFAPSYIKDDALSTRWLYQFVADQWKEWLTDDAYKSLAAKGYYTMLIKPKLRLVAMNSNICNVDNLWIVYDELYYQEQLLWLINILKTASNTGEKVHIIGHVASNHERCDRKWTMDLRNIIERYADVIAGHFNGHSHIDEFVAYYSSVDKNAAVNVAWNGGSGTNFIGLNSNFKFYIIDDQKYEILDSESWIFNLTDANLGPGRSPKWYQHYTFTSYFNVKDMSPSSIHNLITRFKTDKNLLWKYWVMTQKQSDVALRKGCDDSCLQAALDSITRTSFPTLNIYKGSESKAESYKSVLQLL